MSILIDLYRIEYIENIINIENNKGKETSEFCDLEHH